MAHQFPNTVQDTVPWTVFFLGKIRQKVAIFSALCYNERGKRFDKENDSYGEPGGLSGNQRNPEYDGKRDSQKFNGELCDRIKKRSAVSR